MFKEIIKWDIYEIRTGETPIVGVMFRGRVRKYCLEQNRNVLVENAQEADGAVRFAVPTGEDVSGILAYLGTIVPDVKIEMVQENIPNPVLSKLIVNIEDRYTL